MFWSYCSPWRAATAGNWRLVAQHPYLSTLPLHQLLTTMSFSDAYEYRTPQSSPWPLLHVAFRGGISPGSSRSVGTHVPPPFTRSVNIYTLGPSLPHTEFGSLFNPTAPTRCSDSYWLFTGHGSYWPPRNLNGAAPRPP